MIKLCVYIFIGFENKQKFKTKILRLARVGISPYICIYRYIHMYKQKNTCIYFEFKTVYETS